MKISVVIIEGAKQIMLTPETDHEKESLSYINPDSKVNIVMKNGSFGDEDSHANYQIDKCLGGYYRPFHSEDSIMFIIKDEKKEDETT